MAKLSPIKSASRTSQVIEQITESIVKGNWREGDLLPTESQLCEIFGVSRSILREGIKVLASRGILDVRQGSGTVVRRPKDDVPEKALSEYLKFNELTLIQLMEVRRPLEVEISRLAARRCTAERIESLRQTIERMRVRADGIAVYVRADDDFHRILAEATNNPIFGIITRSIVRYLHASRQLTIRHYGVEVVIRDHLRIVRALEKKDAVAAVTAMRSHMAQTIRNLKRIATEKN